VSDARLPETDAEALRAEGVSAATFRAAYARTPPWEIGRAQAEIIRRAEAGAFSGDILDAGCGTGENALYLAGRGHNVLGVDIVPVAIERARAKAAERQRTAEFRVHDVLALEALGRRFETILDCGVFHTFSDDNRSRYVASLGTALHTGGRLVLMCFSEEETREGGPRRVTRHEIRAAFASGWTIESIQATRFEANIFEDGARAWLALIRKD